jgi:hypothetical protein
MPARLLSALLLCLGLGLLAGRGQAASPASAPASGAAPRDRTLLKRLWGVEVLGVRWSAGGYMLEFRYKVLDARLAAPLFDRAVQPLLIHEPSGAAFIVPTPGKVGALRNSDPPIRDRIYWMFFANPGQYVKRGQKVTVQIGRFRAESLVVE